MKAEERERLVEALGELRGETCHGPCLTDDSCGCEGDKIVDQAVGIVRAWPIEDVEWLQPDPGAAPPTPEELAEYRQRFEAVLPGARQFYPGPIVEGTPITELPERLRTTEG